MSNRPQLSVADLSCSQSASEWVIQCDFDGTISLRDTTDSLLNSYGLPGWEALEDAWEQGEIGSKECMQKQVALLDMSPEQLDASLQQIGMDAAFPAFLSAAQQQGIPFFVVSDGLDYAINTILSREGVHNLPILANHLVYQQGNRWSLETPWNLPTCASANCKCQHAQSSHQVGRKVLYIGDGSSDFCVSGKADVVLAKAKLINYCREQGIPHVPFTDFREALALLPGILSGTALEPAV
ncbi:MtnX-like HAD-IB family phosphatase [Paenalcaligenes sp. Me131]|uniref:MtnX-like HAD-IB family phosphatase n=1 Tax=Paenalcaligenes sp. Me131 TaxID=3392636 RepID=UPI003D2B67F1